MRPRIPRPLMVMLIVIVAPSNVVPTVSAGPDRIINVASVIVCVQGLGVRRLGSHHCPVP